MGCEVGATRAPKRRRSQASLVGRGSGITHSFEQSRLLRWTADSLVLRTADLSDIASEASAAPLLQEAKSEPLGVLPTARNGSAAQPDLAMSIRTRSIALRTSHGRSGARLRKAYGAAGPRPTKKAIMTRRNTPILQHSARPPSNLSPVIFHLSHSSV